MQNFTVEIKYAIFFRRYGLYLDWSNSFWSFSRKTHSTSMDRALGKKILKLAVLEVVESHLPWYFICKISHKMKSLRNLNINLCHHMDVVGQKWFILKTTCCRRMSNIMLTRLVWIHYKLEHSVTAICFTRLTNMLNLLVFVVLLWTRLQKNMERNNSHNNTKALF